LFNKVTGVTNEHALWGHSYIGLFRKILLMNHFVIVFNMLSGEHIKAYWVSCMQFDAA